MNSVIHDPQAVLAYGFDWADGGANDGGDTDTGWLSSDTITTSTWSISGPDALLVVDSDANDTTTTTVVLSGGTANSTYSVVNHIVTAAGYEDERSLIVKVQQR